MRLRRGRRGGLFEVGLGSGLARRSLGFVGASLDIHLPLGSLPTRNLLDGLVIVAVAAGTFYVQSFKRVLLPDMFEAFEISCLQPLFGIKTGARPIRLPFGKTSYRLAPMSKK
jgi:hypothetical protein